MYYFPGLHFAESAGRPRLTLGVEARLCPSETTRGRFRHRSDAVRKPAPDLLPGISLRGLGVALSGRPCGSGRTAGSRKATRQGRWGLGIQGFRVARWPPPIGHWSLVIGAWSLVPGHWSFIARLSTFGFPLLTRFRRGILHSGEMLQMGETIRLRVLSIRTQATRDPAPADLLRACQARKGTLRTAGHHPAGDDLLGGIGAQILHLHVIRPARNRSPARSFFDQPRLQPGFLRLQLHFETD